MAKGDEIDRDRSRDLVVPKSGVPIKRIATPLARRFAQICTSILADMTAEADLTPLQYAALSYLFDEPDIDQNALASRLGIDRTSTGQLIDQMETKDSSIDASTVPIVALACYGYPHEGRNFGKSFAQRRI